MSDPDAKVKLKRLLSVRCQVREDMQEIFGQLGLLGRCGLPERRRVELPPDCIQKTLGSPGAVGPVFDGHSRPLSDEWFIDSGRSIRPR